MKINLKNDSLLQYLYGMFVYCKISQHINKKKRYISRTWQLANPEMKYLSQSLKNDKKKKMIKIAIIKVIIFIVTVILHTYIGILPA